MEKSIPDDMVCEILSRLPTKSVCRFKCVSTSWYHLTSSRQFTETHFKNSPKGFSHTQILLSENGKLCSLDSFLHNPIVDISHAVGSSCFLKKIIGSCNGIICFAGYKNASKDVILWNPSTRERHKLPKTPTYDDNLKPFPSLYLHAYGFGYDKSKDDCKVVSFMFSCLAYTCDAAVGIYSMRSGEWKQIENHRCKYGQLASNKHGNGKIYWIVSRKYIHYLDLETEKYGRIEKAIPEDPRTEYMKLEVVSEGCIYVLCSDKHFGEVWMLNSYEDVCWKKLVTISHVGDFRNYYNEEHFHVLDHTNAEILLMYGRRFTIFNMNYCSFRYPDSRECIFEALTYVPSLLSPLVSPI